MIACRLNNRTACSNCYSDVLPKFLKAFKMLLNRIMPYFAIKISRLRQPWRERHFRQEDHLTFCSQDVGSQGFRLLIKFFRA